MLVILYFWFINSLCSPVWPRMCAVLPALASQVLGLQVGVSIQRVDCNILLSILFGNTAYRYEASALDLEIPWTHLSLSLFASVSLSLHWAFLVLAPTAWFMYHLLLCLDPGVTDILTLYSYYFLLVYHEPGYIVTFSSLKVGKTFWMRQSWVY